MLSTLLTLALSGVPAATGPTQIVSINLCSDQLTVALVPKPRIASLSRLVADPGVSQLAADRPQAIDGIVLNDGLAEEILALRPELVIAGRYSAQPTVALLKRLGIPLLTLDIARSLADVRRRMSTVAEALGAQQRAALLLQQFDARLAALRVDAPQTRPLAIYFQPNGYTAGKGSLIDDIMQRAGLRNLGAELGIEGHGKVSLEQVLMAEPELLIIDERDPRYPSLATEFLSHPALQALAGRVPKVQIPPRLWLCGLPGSLDALELLVRARTELMRGRLNAAVTTSPIQGLQHVDHHQAAGMGSIGTDRKYP